MTKNFKYIALSIIGTALISCTSTEEPDIVSSMDEYISFAQPTVNLNATIDNFAESQHNTRTASWTSIDEFKVWGFCVPYNVDGTESKSAAIQEWNEKSTFFTKDPDIFNGLTVYDNGNSYCSYDNNNTPYKNDNFKQWRSDVSDNASYSFIAGYVPSGLGSFKIDKALQTTEKDETTGKNKSYGPKLTFTINQNNNDTTNNLDFKKQPDALLAATFNHRKSDGRVGLSFFHFMTGIRFKFHNYTSDKTLKIKKVTYRGIFHKTATFDFTTDEPTMSVSGEYAGKFILFDGEQIIPAGGSRYMGDLNDNDDDIVTLLLLPDPNGTTTPDEHFTLGSYKQIQIVYEIGEVQKTFTYGKNFTLNYIPKPNTLHTAHFNFIGDEFVVMFQADDKKNWENGSDNTVTIN